MPIMLMSTRTLFSLSSTSACVICGSMIMHTAGSARIETASMISARLYGTISLRSSGSGREPTRIPLPSPSRSCSSALTKAFCSIAGTVCASWLWPSSACGRPSSCSRTSYSVRPTDPPTGSVT